MATDEERRMVARRLRGPFDVIGQGRYVSLNGTLFGMQLLANSENELRAGVRRLADLIDPEPERTCKVVRISDFGGSLGEHGIWYECGARLLVADGTPDPVYCPGCGGRIE